MKKQLQADIILLAVTFIWGATFVIVQNAIDSLPPLSFNAIRFAIAAIFLFLVLLLKDRTQLRLMKRSIWLSGFILGILLASGYIFQTFGLLYTSSSKAGFLTGLSVVFVPLFAFFILKHKPSSRAIIGVIIATAGLYMLTIGNSFIFNIGDILVFFCAISFALQIIFTGKYAPQFPALSLALVQITTVALISGVSAFLFESPLQTISSVTQPHVMWALIITAIPATALAFLAQTHFQKYTTPTRVVLIFAMEPVFAAVAGYWWAGDILHWKEWMGCGMIFLGMLVTEVPLQSLLRKWRPVVKKAS